MRHVEFAVMSTGSVHRKLKQLLQRKKSELEPKQQEELNKSLLSYEKDHILCPFIGINPEYMEMSESQRLSAQISLVFVFFFLLRIIAYNKNHLGVNCLSR